MRNLLLSVLLMLSSKAHAYLTTNVGNATSIQNIPVSATPPGTNECLVSPDGLSWAPGSCSSGTGTVTGPVSSVANGIATWSDTTGIPLLSPSGFTIASNKMTVSNLLDSGLTASQAVVSDGSKNLVSMAYSAAGGASNFCSRDSSGNSKSVNWISGITNVTSAGATTTLTVASNRLQQLTGTLAQTFQLPDATTLALGTTFEFDNNSTGSLSVVDNGSNAIATVPAGGYSREVATAVATANGSWDTHFLVPANGSYGTAGLAVTGTLSATSTVTFSGLTASQAVFTDGSKHLVSNAITGTGSVVMSAGPTFTSKALFSDGSSVYNLAPGWGTPTTCTTTGTVNFNSLQVATQELDLTASDTCVLTISGIVAGGSYVLHVKNAASAVLTLPGAVDFGGATYTPGSSGTYDNISLLVTSSTSHINGAVSGTGYAN